MENQNTPNPTKTQEQSQQVFPIPQQPPSPEHQQLQFSPPPTPANGKKKTFIIGTIILLVFLLTGSGLYYLSPMNTQTVTPTPQPTTIPTPAATLIPTLAQSAKDCGLASIHTVSTDALKNGTPNPSLICFSEQVKTCTPAKVAINSTLEMAGMTRSITNFQINGMKGDKCEMAVKQGEITHVFPSDVPQETQNIVNQALQKKVGSEGVCLYNMADLNDLFTKWSTGEMSTDDYVKGQCTGTFFEAQ